MLLASACGAPAPSKPRATSAPAVCAPLPPLAAQPESLSAAFQSEVSPADAPDPHTAAERFLFAQLYETLVRVDCEGRLYPGLARSWTVDASGHRWTIRLGDDARFWSGDSVTASAVVAAWRATAELNAGGASGDLARQIADSAVIVNDRTLLVTLPAGPDSPPLALASQSLAVYRGRPGSSWPEGTGYYRLASASGVRQQHFDLVPSRPGAGPRLTVRTARDLDLRDLLDEGTDLVLTGNPVTLGYAAARGDIASIPLPWSRSYALLIPRRVSAAVPGSGASGAATAFGTALARDAVRVEARPAEAPFPWEQPPGCGTLQPASVTRPWTSSGDRIVYRADDAVARELAERLVALAEIESPGLPSSPLAVVAPELQSGGRGAVAVALAPADFAAALRAGGELAYVVEFPRRSLAPCAGLGPLASASPWLTTDAARHALVPLVDTRDRVVVRRDRVSIVIDWDGTLHLAPPAIASPTG